RGVARALEDHLEPGGVRDRDAADIEEVDGGGELMQPAVALEAEAREQDFERHAIADVREVGAVEVEAEGAPGPVAGLVQPFEARLAVDEALDEPGACEAVDP